MNENKRTQAQYDEMYRGESYYWTVRPSRTCLEVLERMPPDRPLRLLDIGCGEGRNAVFFARNGYEVHAFDISGKGLEKTRRLAERAGVSVRVFQEEIFDCMSSGVPHQHAVNRLVARKPTDQKTVARGGG